MKFLLAGHAIRSSKRFLEERDTIFYDAQAPPVNDHAKAIGLRISWCFRFGKMSSL